MKRGKDNKVDLVAMVEIMAKQLRGKDELIEAMSIRISELEQTVNDRDLTIIKLNDQISTLTRSQFGTKSEKTHAKDGNGSCQSEVATMSQSFVSDREEPFKKKEKVGYRHPGKRNYDDIVPTKVTHIRPSAEEIKGARFVRKVVSYRFIYVPAHVEKEQIIRYVYSKDGRLIIPPLPYAPEEFEKRHLDASLAAGILTNKYHYHLPYERQLSMLNNGDIKIAKTTLHEYGKASIDALNGLYESIREKVLSDNRCHIDETVQHVVDKENHKCRKGYDWGFVSPKYKLMFFASNEGSRGMDVLDEHLKDFHGKYIQTDGYAAYKAVGERLGKTIIQVPCMAHIRRYFIESKKYHYSKAMEGLDLINPMFGMEDKIKAMHLPAVEVAALRRKMLRPLLDKFKLWLIKTKESKDFFDDDNLGKAVNYAMERIDKFNELMKNGQLNLTNNLAERSMRGHTLGRKNYLFCQNSESESRTCKIYSVIESCKLSGVDPYLYLNYIFRHEPKFGEKWEDLLPGNIKHKLI